ncbi:MAG TPA: TetR/AcrR family transcriptional regulator [Micromonosporaceae bacterium]|jgi:AcrR family transcriptional regulator|nr:TetR/AcrR family transcriptional regulator [Mycobacterium sp.]
MADQQWRPRERMVYSAVQLVRERGVAATGVRDVVEHANAPRGSFQHYFPGGKDHLVSDALLWAGDYATDWVARYAAHARKPTPSGLFAHLVSPWKREFTTRGYARGCPIMATAADLAGTDSPVNEPLRAALARWEDAISTALTQMGVPAARARRLSTLMLSTLEGAIMMARVNDSVRPLTTVVNDLAPLLDSAVT